MKNERNSSFELLRILAMFLIIGHHFVWYSGIMGLDAFTCKNVLPAQVLYIGGPLGVDIFFMLSGYFYGNKFKTAKLVKLDLTIIFYSVLGLLFSTFKLHQPHENIDVVKAIFPLSTTLYWFLTVYAIVLIASPLLSKAIEKMNKKQFLVIGLFILFYVSVFPSVAFKMSLWHFDTMMIRGFLCYFIGAYLKKYPIKFLNHPIPSLLCFIASFASMAVISIYSRLNPSVELWDKAKALSVQHMSVLMLLCAMSAIMLASSIHIGSVKIINLLSSATLGVYIIHDNPNVRSYIWKTLLKTDTMIRSEHYLSNAFCCILLVFLGCAAIEIVRKNILEPLLDKWFCNIKLFQKTDEIVNLNK